MAIDERIKRLKALSQKMPDSVRVYQNHTKEDASSLLLRQKQELYERWSELEEHFKKQRNTEGETSLRDIFLEKIHFGIKTLGKDYISVIKGIEVEDTKFGTNWLQGIVDNVTAQALKIIPSFY